MYEIIADPKEGDRIGNFVNFFILGLIAVNVLVGILETIEPLRQEMPNFFYWFETASVIIFTVEYLIRLWACTSQEEFQHPIKGRIKLSLQPMPIIDLLAILPFYIQMVVPSGMDLRFIRILRLFRLFRLFRMGSLMKAVRTLSVVFKRKKNDLSIAIIVLGIVVIFAASLMYLAEGKTPGTKFTSIPASMYWAMITVTTIGYGDMFPVTAVGQILGALIGFAGVCVFALPVAILGAGFIEEVDPDFEIGPAKPKEENQLPKEGESPPSETQEQANTPGSSPPYDDAFVDAVADRVASKIADQVAAQVIAHLNKQK